ncbi:MAG: hypothetical protein JOZ72_06885 [Alphaproteobacteria bacterium]|nr:hypothetical protein [Alphaproteobacteria bacterium]
MYRVNLHVLPGLLLGTAISLSAPALAASYKPLHDFTGLSHGDGQIPSGELVADSLGRLYGTTFLGGTHGGGTVFRLTKNGRSWSEEILFNFPGSAGVMGGVAIGPSGELYGTTKIGGFASSGTVWRLNTDGTLTTLHEFNPAGGDGFFPEAGLVMGKDGMLYGTTAGQPPQDGGVPGPNVIYGTVYRVSPDGDASKYAVLHVFGATSDGQFPLRGRLLVDRKGVLTGTTNLGGKNSDGTVYRLSPPKKHQTAWTETVLHDFPTSGQFDAVGPVSGVARALDGTLYGCAGGGTHGNGAVYALKTTGEEQVLYNFGDHADDPAAATSCAVMVDADGTLYGTSQGGGANANKGTLFSLTPPAGGSGAWTVSVLHSFGAGDGQSPDAAPLKRGKMLYGTAELGGSAGDGMAFVFKP